jgi:hypothetical protein
MCVWRNIEAFSCNYCCSKKVKLLLIVTVFVGSVMEHAMGMRHIAICGLSGSTIFFHIIS